jgi:hypothetical protein
MPVAGLQVEASVWPGGVVVPDPLLEAVEQDLGRALAGAVDSFVGREQLRLQELAAVMSLC